MAKFFGKSANNTNNEVEQSTVEQEDVTQNDLILIKGKVADKSVKSFLSCGTKFTDQFQELQVNAKTLKRLKQEKMITIQEIK